MAVLGVAKANFPQIEVDDRMKLAATPAARDRWLGTVGFAVKVLANLRRGTVEYNGADLSISGEAESFASYKSARSALRNLPQGVRLAGDELVPPPASPFVWRVKQSGGEPYCPGSFLPSRCAPRLSNGPRGSSPTAPSSIAWTPPPARGLGEGGRCNARTARATHQREGRDQGPVRLDLRPGERRRDGRGGRRRAARRRARRVRGDGGLHHAEAQAAPAGPYVTTIAASAAGSELAGLVPSEAAHAVLVEAASRWRGLPLTDRLQIAAGAGDGWQACMLAGVAGLARLSSGRAHLSGARLELTGQTEDQALVEQLPAACARLPTNPAKLTSGSRSRRRLWWASRGPHDRARSRCGRRRSGADRNRRDRAPAGRRRSLPG